MSSVLSLQMLYRVSYLFVAFARLQAGARAAAREATMRARVERWLTGPHAGRLEEVVGEGERMLAMYGFEGAARRAAYRHAFMLCTALTAHQRRDFVTDLVAIADAGGGSSEAEVAFITMILRVFGIGEHEAVEGARASVA